jgi:hypothetical protein
VDFLTYEKYFLRQRRGNVGGEEVWTESEGGPLAAALVGPRQEDETLLLAFIRRSLVPSNEEFLDGEGVGNLAYGSTLPSLPHHLAGSGPAILRELDPDPIQ